MSLDLQQFRQFGFFASTRMVVQQGADGEAVVKSRGLGLATRINAALEGGSFKHGFAQHQNDNKNFKTKFFEALVKAEGIDVAKAAVKAAGLDPDWISRPNSISAKRCKRVLNEALQLRMGTVKANNRDARTFIDFKAAGRTCLAGMLRERGLPSGHAENRGLQATFLREVRADARFGSVKFGNAHLAEIADRAITKFYDGKEKQFAEAHPGLRQYQQDQEADLPFVATGPVIGLLKDQLNGAAGQDHPLFTEPQACRALMTETLAVIETTGDVLATTTWTPAGWAAQTAEIDARLDRLEGLANRLVSLSEADGPTEAQGTALQMGLVIEIDHQKSQLLAKRSFIQEIRDADPLSDVSVAYSNLLWAEAAGHIANSVLGDPGIDLDPMARRALTNEVIDLIGEKSEALATAKNAPSQRTAGTKIGDGHPAARAKAETKDRLKTILKNAGVPSGRIDTLLSAKGLGEARMKALNGNQEWTPVTNRMLVTKDGVTREYLSVIKPAACISRRFVDAAGQQASTPGISSATKTDHHHARNLKVSELQRAVPGQDQPVTIARVIGHGVLDMWMIADPAERRTANETGAREVLEAALATNPRLAAAAAAQGENGAAVRMTHVSVNLITPATWREVGPMRSGMPDYQERAYTKEQFRAFAAVSSQPDGAPVTLTMDGPDDPTRTIDVRAEVDTIAFSFGINPLATGTGASLFGGWGNVIEENRTAMVRFIGDLGLERASTFGSQGKPPGGFIGSVYDRLSENDAAQAELRAKLRVQTNTVRELFTTKAYETGNGDPAKMGREILALQALAEQAFTVIGAEGEAATMSKGCKSDKDRGGVTDVELKHKLITEDMGGLTPTDAELDTTKSNARRTGAVPNAELQDDDLTNYGIVSARSGQLENQRYNTGLPGSKEAGKLEERNQSRELRQYLEGLGALAAE